MHLFYIENNNWINLEAGFIQLQDEEAKHASKVLRLKDNDKVQATDGLGNWFDCTIVEIQKKQCLLKIDNHISEKGKRDYRIHIAIAPTKNIKRFEWFLEKATEMGIDEITPIITSHSERKTLKIERSNSIITSAMKQSLKAYHPKLNETINFTKFLENINEDELFMAHLIDENQLDLKEKYSKGKDVCILIGPEGDFNNDEVKLAQEKGFITVKMGIERLRTETAAMVACNIIHFIND